MRGVCVFWAGQGQGRRALVLYIFESFLSFPGSLTATCVDPCFTYALQ